MGLMLADGRNRYKAAGKSPGIAQGVGDISAIPRPQMRYRWPPYRPPGEAAQNEKPRSDPGLCLY